MSATFLRAEVRGEMNVNLNGSRKFTIWHLCSELEVVTWEGQTVLTFRMVIGVLQLRPQNVCPSEEPSTLVRVTVTEIISVHVNETCTLCCIYLCYISPCYSCLTKLHDIKSLQAVHNFNISRSQESVVKYVGKGLCV